MEEDFIFGLIERQDDESLSVEFKGPLKWENNQASMSWLQAKCIKAVLGFSNTPGGGLVLIGINDDGKGNREFVGLTPEMVESFNNTEAIQECIDKYADGPLSYSLKTIIHKADKEEQTYIAITVNEFDDMPNLCTRDFYIVKTNRDKDYILRKHDMYTRARKGRFSTIKATALELRSIVSLAHRKTEDDILQLFEFITGNSVPSTKTKKSPYEDLDIDL
jgi:hypothetical protein